MLSGSAILRVVVLFVAAAVLAGLVQVYWSASGVDGASEPQPGPVQRPEPVRPEISRTEPSRTNPPPSEVPRAERRTDPAPTKDAGQPLAPSPIRPLPKPTLPTAPDIAAAPPAPTPRPSDDAGSLAATPPSVAQTGQEAVDSAADTAGPRAVSIVDLNTGSLAELNGLKGGGKIGRAIVQRRPYTSVDQLLSKRVLSRSTYDRVKDQVTVH